MYYTQAGCGCSGHGEVAELAERARLEIVYTPKGYRGFKSLLLRHNETPWKLLPRGFFFPHFDEMEKYSKYVLTLLFAMLY